MHTGANDLFDGKEKGMTDEYTQPRLKMSEKLAFIAREYETAEGKRQSVLGMRKRHSRRT